MNPIAAFSWRAWQIGTSALPAAASVGCLRLSVIARSGFAIRQGSADYDLPTPDDGLNGVFALHLEAHFQVRSADLLEPGSLFRGRYEDKGALGILLRRLEHGAALCALLDSPTKDEKLPCYMRVEPEDEPCMDYGTGWELELIEGPESYPGNSDFWNLPGTIHASSNGLFMHLARPPGDIGQGAADVDLGTGEFVDSVKHKLSVPFTRWRIWARPDLKTRPGATPLFSFPNARK